MMKNLLLAAVLLFAGAPSFAQDDLTCDQIRRQLEKKLRDMGEKDFYLQVVPFDQVKGARVVGSCDDG